MKKIYVILLFLAFSATAQEREVKTSRFVNQTEIGLLAGRSLTGPTYYYPYYPNPYLYLASSSYIAYPKTEYKEKNTGSLSIQTFNGWRIRPRTAVGLTTGLDAYQGALIMPVAAGVRQVLFEKGPTLSKIQASLDLGAGTLWLDGKDEVSKKGGLMVNPAVGFIFPTRSGSAFLLNFGYKYQYYSISDAVDADNFREESRNIKRLQLRLGFQF